MGRAPCCDKGNVKRGPWSPEEDLILKDYLQKNGCSGNWISLPQKAGLKRCGKSCRLRWLNYLRPDIKHGGYSEEEDRIIFSLYKRIGSRWSVIAGHLPGRTDNDVKNYWNTKLKKKLMAATSCAGDGTSTSSSTQCNPLPPSPLTATSSTTATMAPVALIDAPRPALPPPGCRTDIARATPHSIDDDVLHFLPCPMQSSLVVPMQQSGPFPTAGDHHGPDMVSLPADVLFEDMHWSGVDVHSYCGVGYPSLVDYDIHRSSISGSMNSSSPASANDLSSFTSLLSHVSGGGAVGETTNQQGLCGSLAYPSY